MPRVTTDHDDAAKPLRQRRTRLDIRVFGIGRLTFKRDTSDHKRDTDIELGRGHRLILTDTVTGARFALTVASGAVVLTAL